MWEYTTLILATDGLNEQDCTEKFSKLGNEGWILFSAIPIQKCFTAGLLPRQLPRAETVKIQYIFKRQRQ